MDTIVIQEVEVSAPRKSDLLAFKVSRPDSLVLVSGLTTDLSELLSHHTPVFIKSYGRGSQATASFRGTAASHTQILWNGMKLNSPGMGYADLSLLPLFFIDDVYLLHGGSSLAGSSGALGGSIHLDNSPDWSKKTILTAIVERGSFHSGKYLAKLHLGDSTFNSVTRFYYDASLNDFPFMNVGVMPYRQDTLKNGDYRKTAVLQEFNIRINTTSMTSLRMWYQESHRNLPPLMSYEGNPGEENQQDRQMRIQYELKKYGRNSLYSFFSGCNASRMHYYRRSSAREYVMDDAVSLEKSWYNQVRANKEFTASLALSGMLEANYHVINVENQVTGNGYDENRLEAGGLLRFQWTPSERLGMFILSGSEFYDDKIIPLIPAAGLEWQVTRSHPVFLKASVSHNFHKPGLNDLYWIPGGNHALLPERGNSGEISVAASSRFMRVWFKQEATLFLSHINNWIIWQPSVKGAWYWEASNLKDVVSRGVEYDFNGSFNYKYWTISCSGNYAFTRTMNMRAVSSADLSRRKQLIYIPKHTFNLHLSAIYKGWTLITDSGYTGRRYTQSSNLETFYESVLNPFWMTGISAERRFPGKTASVSMRFKVENVFDTDYQQILWRPMPGRHYSLILALDFKK